MGRQFTKGIDLYNAQKERFARLQLGIKQAHESLATDGLADWKELTDGEPDGKARTKMLRDLGHPFGRGENAAASTPTGRRRTVKKARLAAAKLKGNLPLLPIGSISGQLKRSIKKRKLSVEPQKFAVGPTGAGKSTYVLALGGTKKMVARGLKAEVAKRWKARNKALLDEFRDRQRNQH